MYIASKKVPSLLRVAPGLRSLLGYRREWLRHDAVPGVPVAAVALPTAVAYAELIGFEAAVDLYASILPSLVPEILVTQAVSADVPVIREWVGTLDGSENADIRARVSGICKRGTIKRDRTSKRVTCSSRLIRDRRPKRARTGAGDSGGLSGRL